MKCDSSYALAARLHLIYLKIQENLIVWHFLETEKNRRKRRNIGNEFCKMPKS